MAPVRRHLAAAAFAVLAFDATTTRAAEKTPAVQSPPPSPSNEAQLAEARRLFEEGVRLHEKSDYVNALTAFQSAFAIAQAATILYNIGLTYRSLRRYPEAIESLERYLGSASRDGQLKRARRRQVSQLIDEMKSQLVAVTFAIKPATAQLSIDGAAVPLPKHGTLPLPVGKHLAQVSAPEHEPQQREFTVTNIPVVISFALFPKPSTSKLRITSSQPGTTVAIDGRDRGLAPLELELGLGAHQLSARREGFEPLRADVVLESGQERTVDLTLLPVRDTRPPLYQRWWFWTGIGAAVVGGTVAAFTLRPGTQAPLAGSLGSGSVSLGALAR